MNFKPYRELTDEELILLLQSEDNRQAFDELIFRYKDKIINYVYRFTNNRDDAEDITQDSFLRLYKYRNGYREVAKFSTWFYSIVINCMKKKYKSDKKFLSVSIDEMDEAELETGDLIFEQEEPESLDENSNKMEYLKKAFDLLDETFKEVILLRYTEELEYDRIAEILDIPMGTVKSRINRGREHLKNIMIKLYRE